MKRKSKKSEYEPKKCCLCDKVALYRVYFKGYCKAHYEDAVKDEASVRAKQTSFAIARKMGLHK